jgi:hypothetical protein
MVPESVVDRTIGPPRDGLAWAAAKQEGMFVRMLRDLPS